MHKAKFLLLAVPVVLAGCASPPMGPTVQVLPGSSKPFEAFQQDQATCRQYAQSQVAGQAEAVNNGTAGTVVVGTVLGGLLGAAIGNHQGAGIGAATGAIAGTSVGAGSAAYGQGSIQAQYNNAYVQCMYARGNQVPGMRRQQYRAPVQADPPPGYPPAGYAPQGYGPPAGAPPVIQAPPGQYYPPGYYPPGYGPND